MLKTLRVADHPAAVWAAAVEPWLRAHGTQWRERRAVLVPHAAWAAALKAQAVEHEIQLVGVSWFTPGKWRAQALRARPGPAPKVALREDLHLIFELAAAGLPENALARAYGPDPAPFQEMLDELEGAGWDPGVLPNPAARELAAAVVARRAASGWITATAADRVVRAFFSGTERGGGSAPVLGERLLAVGFGPGEWNLRALLEAAVAAYAESELVLDVVDYEQDPAAAWVGTWEEAAGAAEWIEAPENQTRYAPWAAAFQAQVRPEAAELSATPEGAAPTLWLADDLQGEADLVVAQALEFLGEADAGKPARVGIVAGPVNSPLAREVAARLARMELPHHDTPGHRPGRTGAQEAFEAWLDWQENGRLDGWLAWLRSAHRLGRVRDTEATTIEAGLQNAAQATLSDDPAVLGAWLRQQGQRDGVAFIEEWPRLPEGATWDDWTNFIMPVAQTLHWPEAPEELADRLRGWADKSAGTPVPRGAVLRWVRAVTSVPGRTREALGREPFAPLQVTDAASAVAQPWTHLVLAGLQHGEWPEAKADSPLFEETRRAALNRKVLREGTQGEGHQVVAPGQGWMMTMAEQRRLQRANFARLMGMPSGGLALTARQRDPADGRPARLSEYFWAVAAQKLGRLPTEAEWAALGEASRSGREAVREAVNPPAAETKVSGTELPAVAAARAFAARRDPETPFDEYSFCLKGQGGKPLRLSCKAWEKAVARPGATWMEQLWQVGPRWEAATEDFGRLSVGNWAHAWVRPGPAGPGTAPESRPAPGGGLWQKLAREGARDTREAVARAFTAGGRVLPEYWLDAWARAGRMAQEWIAVLAATDGGGEVLAEASLPKGLTADLPGMDFALPMAGRMDLVRLSRAATLAPEGLAGAAAWLIDFKTGQDAPLQLKRLAKGEGLQLALYALALRTMGAATVDVTLLNEESGAEAQLNVDELSDESLRELWQIVTEFSRDGQWGERHDLTGGQENPGDYPSATLPVPGEIVRHKWALTHLNFKP